MESQLFEIILGSYEEFLLGYKYVPEDLKPVQSFASHSHTSSIRSVASEGNLLASGGADDRIVIYDLKSRKELCTLDHHSGTVNCLQFTKNATHLVSGGADGTFAIVRTGSWLLEKTWTKAHKGFPIIDIAIHDSGKLALTLGGDYTLRTWNLVKGRQAFAVNLTTKSSDAKSLQQIKWASDGVLYTLAGGKYTEVWSIETGGIVKSVEHEERVVCCIWLSDSSLVVGYENGKLAIVNVKNGDIKMIDGHDSRVKSICLYEDHLVTASSNGEVKVWNLEFAEILKFNTGCRLTCLCILPPLKLKKEKVKSVETVDVSHEKTLPRNNDKHKATITVEETDILNTPPNKKKKKRSLNSWSVEKIKH